MREDRWLKEDPRIIRSIASVYGIRAQSPVLVLEGRSWEKSTKIPGLPLEHEIVYSKKELKLFLCDRTIFHQGCPSSAWCLNHLLRRGVFSLPLACGMVFPSILRTSRRESRIGRISTGCAFFLVNFVLLCYHRLMRWPRMRVRRLFIFPTLIILALGTFSRSQSTICIVT